MAPSYLPSSPPGSSNQSLFAGYDSDGELSLDDGSRRARQPTYAQRFVPPALLAASRRFPLPTQLVSSRPFAYSAGALTLLALLFFLLPSSSSSGRGDYPSGVPKAGWSQAHGLLYAPPAADGVCAFLDPTLGFSKDERKLVQQLQKSLQKSSPHDGLPRWQGGLKMDLPNALQPDFPFAPATSQHPDADQLGLTNALESKVHPIFSLVARGEQKFRGMVARRSTTLKQAVAEYRSRYGRAPPKGFDKWWQYATDNDVLLPDEYDSIYDSLAPFMGFTHAEFTRRLAEAKTVRGTVFIEIRDHEAEVVYTAGQSENDYWTHRRSDGQLHLINPIVSELPDLTIVFGLKDEPQVLLDWENKAALLEASHQQKPLDVLPESTSSSRLLFPLACPPNSPLRHGSPPPTSPHHQFITPASHRAAQNPCFHPAISDGHGFLVGEKGPWTDPTIRFGGDGFVPLLAMSKVEGMGDMGGIPFDKDDFEKEHVDPLAWEDKKSEKLYWRGHSTGGVKDRDHGHRWRESHRMRLHKALNDESRLRTLPVLVAKDDGEAKTKYFAPDDVRQWGYDVKLAGKPVQCDDNDGTCEEMRKIISWAPEDGQEVGDNAKYLFDVDGNAWTSRFRRLMDTNSLVLKATIFPEWNTDILPEWFAYVPMKMDYTDIPSVMAFFRGPPSPSNDGKGLRDEVARRLAHNSHCWVQRTWRKEDLLAYQYRFLLEYARIESGGAWGDLDEADM